MTFLSDAASSIVISNAVVDEICSWRRVIDGCDGADPRSLLGNAAGDLFRTLEVDKTVRPEAHRYTRQVVVDALAAMAEAAGIGPDEAQAIFAKCFTRQEQRSEPRKTTPVDICMEDFAAYMPQHTYIFKPTRETWPASSVNARVPPVRVGQKSIPAATWLDANAPVEQMTWAPGEPMEIKNKLVSDGGWIKRVGVTCFNLYRPPIIEGGNPAKAGRWLDHIKRAYPVDADHVVEWLAHRVQRPHEKTITR